MTPEAGTRRPPVGQWASLALLGSLLAALATTADLAEARPKFRPPTEASLVAAVNEPANSGLAGEGLAPQGATGCDLLSQANANLASSCQCKDAEPPSGSFDSMAVQVDKESQNRVSQFNCFGQQLSQIRKQLQPLADSSGAKSIPQIDYLSISANLSLTDPELIARPFKWPPTRDKQHAHRLQVDHLALQLVVTGAVRTNAQVLVVGLEGQLMEFMHLINETNLHFLSIFIEQLHFGDDESDDLSVKSTSWAEMSLTKILANLVGLERLELSFGGGRRRSSSSWQDEDDFKFKLLLDGETFRQHNKLKWLNLASNNWIDFVEFDSNLRNEQEDDVERRPGALSPFGSVASLEYLNLEWNNLRKFPIFSLLAKQQELLASLNLAGNRLVSLELDLFPSGASNALAESSSSSSSLLLFCQQSKTPRERQNTSSSIGITFATFPMLTQLDLSNNQILGLTAREAQYILCTMPNLNQLYLKHNKIVHLNLNSLLVLPFVTPNPLLDTSISSSPFWNESRDSSREILATSKLELLDLSHNHLLKLTAFPLPVWASRPRRAANRSSILLVGPPRIKSVNLNHNQLSRALDVLDANLLNRVIFKEHFDVLTASESPEPSVSLQDLLDLGQAFEFRSSIGIQPSSLCDYLSPSPAKLSSSSGSDDDSDLIYEVILANNQLDAIRSVDFNSRQCESLQILKLSKNRIQSIELDSFSRLKNLEQLDLSHNLVTNISEKLFTSTRRLKQLNLSKNKLKLLGSTVFLHLLELEELLLNDNELLGLPSDLFSQNEQLNVIDLSNNKLTHLNDAVFANLNQLKILNLDGNQLGKFSQELFIVSTVSKSRGFSLFASLLQQKPSTRVNATLKGIPKSPKTAQRLQKPPKKRHNRRMIQQISSPANVEEPQNPEAGESFLILANNQLETIEFSGQDDQKCGKLLQNLHSIWLNNNQLQKIKEDTFRCLRYLTRLYLQANKIKSIDSMALNHLVALEHLDLSENQISHMASGLLPAGSLHHLLLAENYLNKLTLTELFASPSSSSSTTDTEEHEKQIETLDLSGNSNLILDSSDLIKFMLDNSMYLKSVNLSMIDQVKEYPPSAATIVSRADDANNFMNLRSIGLAQINAISDSFFGSMNNFTFISSLERINLSSSISRLSAKSRHLQIFLLSQLRNNLFELNLNGNPNAIGRLMSLLNDNLTAPIALNRLTMSSNQLDAWPFSPTLANKLPELKSLDLSRNKLRHLMKSKCTPADEDSSFRRLESLNASFNALIGLIQEFPMQQTTENSSLHVCRLANLMPRIKHLDLSHNRLNWIGPAEFFRDLHSLATLQLEHNQLETLPSVVAMPKSALLMGLAHNPRAKLASPLGRKDIGLSLHASDLDPRVILSSKDSDSKVKCLTIDEYIQIQRFGGGSSDKNLPDSELVTQYNASEDDNDVHDFGGSDECHMINRKIDRVNLDYVGLDQVDLTAAIEIYARVDRYLSLSLKQNSLTEIFTSSSPLPTDQHLIQLVLSANKLGSVSGIKCPNLLELNSLDVSRNLLREFPVNLLECYNLLYLDLSFNRISNSMHPKSQAKLHSVSSLVVLDLSNNQLTQLDGLYLEKMSNLRYLNLKSNQIQSSLIYPNLAVALDEISTQQLHKTKTIARIFSDSLLLESPVESKKYSMEIFEVDANQDNHLVTSYPEASHRHSIKFCTLRQESKLSKICIKYAKDLPRCIFLKIDPNISSCLTNLHDPSNITSNVLLTTNQEISNQSLRFKMSSIGASLDTSNSTSADPVLSFIDFLKTSWLKLRDLHLADQMAALMSYNGDINDSLWLEFGTNKKYRIYTSTLVKFAMLSGSVCIIVLLIAMFMSLTYLTTGSSRRRLRSDRYKRCRRANAELLDATQANDTYCGSSSRVDKSSSSSLSSSQARDSQATTFTNSSAQNATTLTTSATCSSLKSKQSSRSTTRADETQADTVVEADKIPRQLDASQLEHLNGQSMLQQQQAPCSTPSSSLAPSSVETAETLQAVDSIQSGLSANNNPYGPNGSTRQATAQDSGYLATTNLQQHQTHSANVATVMRMVKSNSANFNPMYAQQTSRGSSIDSYGTLNPRYSSINSSSLLRSKLRDLNEQRRNYSTLYQQHHGRYNPSQQTSMDTLAAGPMVEQFKFEFVEPPHAMGELSTDEISRSNLEQDPATLSLLSINTALSSNNFNSQLVSPSSTDTTTAEQVQQASQQTLCSYHRHVVRGGQQEHHQQPFAGNVILEQEEDQQQRYPGTDGNDLLFIGANHLLPPPPPPQSRVFEVLENLQPQQQFVDTNSFKRA